MPSTTLAEAAPAHAPTAPPPSWLILLLATACGLIVANIYYAQPLIGPISGELGLSPQAAGLIVTMSQIGYGAGLLFVVPLGDLLENRGLIAGIIGLAAAGLAAAALCTSALPFLICALVIGLGSVAVQVIVPLAAHLAPEAVRGQVVGKVMSGLMLGIMLARPVSSFITHASSWHVVFALSAALMVALGIVLRLALPRRAPAPGLSYVALLASMGTLLRDTRVLQRRAFSHFFLFGAFSLFWTVVPLLLGQVLHLSQAGIAWFALAGVAGAISAPIAGRVADGGWSHPAMGLAMALVAVAFLLSRLGNADTGFALGCLVAAGILLDFGVTAHLVLAQRAIYALGAEFRGRLNGLFMAIFFAGGAVGSALGGWAYAQGGWGLAAWIGVAMPGVALVGYAVERRAE
jgi:predicted MFS family arabinose efflux permease